ncbi:hypothetical protein Tco_1417825 [Tanacetum coccineum]
MANLEFCDKHNMVAYLKKPTGSEGFQEIVDFLNGSHIRYALTTNPTIYVSLIEKFWQTATVKTVDNGEQEITATVDGKEFTVTEASVRRHLQLADVEGISVLPTTEIFDQLSLMGYVLTDDKLTFQKGKFSPQWRFLIHTILHCLSPKKTAWEQFSSNIATAIICLATNRTFNFSKLIFDGMVKNLDSKYKFLMYPRFIQIFLNKNKRFLNPHNRKYIAPTLTTKLFSNMKRGFSEEHTPLFQSMLVIQAAEGEGSGHPSEPQPPPSIAQPTNEEPIPTVVSSSHQKTQTPRQALKEVPRSHGGSIAQTRFEKVPTQSYDSPLPRVNTLGSDEGSIILHELTVKKLEQTIKTSQARRRAKIIVSDDEEDSEDSSKQGRKIDEIDQDPDITLVQHDAEIQARHGQEMEASTKDTSRRKRKYSEAEKARLLAELINQRKRYFARQRAKERRNKPLIQAQQRTYMSNYIKQMGSHTLQQLKRLSFDELKNLFDVTMRRVGAFVPMETEIRREVRELAAGSSKRDVEEELDQGSSKRQKTSENSEPAEESKEKEDDKLSQ